ncbi:epidermal growth factor receptor substrate 15-like 1 isoform X2 [Stegodyphus dumicola]|uniref:epidermal growth factor receptor substrate 15-like 1 isoform X2 n=1 Tax=Stegodyphus dumicola TaxID=202533 RepID=UPI0015AFA5F0|nr:epidermal growth factor receptor substrate 15-like 1 isoform X2 [Stegodyphus dumicola]
MMGMLPSPSQVAKSHTAIYEAFYRQVDPAETGSVSALEAAAFLKRSGLPDAILSKIWDMSDPQGKGFLDKQGFFVALKLIALQQNGKDLTIANMSLDVPPPQMQTLSGRNSPAVDWTIKPVERKKYEEMFYSMGPVSGKLPGDKVKPVMLNSKLPLDILGKIWDLSDTDQDGFLSKEEFILAMHLVYKALENIPVPSVLPPELMAILKRKHSISGMVKVLPDVLPHSIDNTVTGHIRRSSTPSSDIIGRGPTWIVNAIDKAKYDEMFHTLDTDKDGFVSGPDIKDTLLKSGLSQVVLAHIWNLCDIKQNGKLNSEQFALAMYLVQQKLQGIEVPAALFPEMIPPTLRPKPSPDITQDVTLPVTTDSESSGSKELDMISSEIKELQMEKMTLEKDLAQKEADVKIKNGELKNLQNEQDALETMLKQLEIQKGEARKRLNDLDKQIDAMKKQKEEQESELEAQEQELNNKRKELNELRQEESKLESQISAGKAQLDALTTTLQNTILQISQLKLKIDQIQEQHRLMSEAIKDMDNAISFGDFRNVSEFTLNGFQPLNEADVINLSPTVPKAVIENEVTPSVVPVGDFQEDPFKSKDPFEGKINGFVNDPFAGEDPFKSDPFKDSSVSTVDPFGGDPFENVFNVTAAQPNNKDDPFLGSDPFGNFNAPAAANADKDPFDPFGLSKTNANSAVVGF